jgi:hypothetical protein
MLICLLVPFLYLTSKYARALQQEYILLCCWQHERGYTAKPRIGTTAAARWLHRQHGRKKEEAKKSENGGQISWNEFRVFSILVFSPPHPLN